MRVARVYARARVCFFRFLSILIIKVWKINLATLNKGCELMVQPIKLMNASFKNQAKSYLNCFKLVFLLASIFH